MNKLRLIKLLVLFLTISIIFGTMALLSQLYQKSKKTSEIAPLQKEINLGKSPQSQILQIVVKDEHLYLLTKENAEKNVIFVLSKDNQKIIQKIQLY